MTRDLIVQDWDLLLRRWRDILGALSVLRYPSSSGQTQCDLITGMPEHGTRKENKTGNEETGIVNKLLIHGDADKSHLGFL